MKTFPLKYYIDLIQSFLDHKISVSEFEQIYLQSFKADETLWSGEKFDVLNGLFGDVDSLCLDTSLHSEGDLDEEQLRRNSEIALTKLTLLENLDE